MLTKEILMELYSVKNMTDKEIADMYMVDRTAIVHRRKEYGIKSRTTLHEDTIPIVTELLNTKGYIVENYKTESKIASLDFVLNKEIKIKVMTANIFSDGYFRFTLTSKVETNHIESENRIKLQNGRYRLKFDNVCDFIIFVGWEGNKQFYWIIPSSSIGNTLQTVALRINSNNRFYEFYENWGLLK